jgi:hypothetical protein
MPDPSAILWGIGMDSIVLFGFEAPPMRELPRRYVQLHPSRTRLLVNPPPADTAVLGSLMRGPGTAVRLTIGNPPSAAAVAPGDTLQVTARITTPPGLVIPAGLNSDHAIRLTYLFWQADWPYLWRSTPLVPLEVDVTGSWEQPLRVRAPDQPGDYQLEIQLVSQVGVWPAQTVRVPVVVR